jgi:hypothetical protein
MRLKCDCLRGIRPTEDEAAKGRKEMKSASRFKGTGGSAVMY